MGKVTGIGGVFFKAKDPEALVAWYREQLGVPFEVQMNCAIFRWDQDPTPNGCTVWGVSKADSDRFQSPESGCTLNYRVDDMASLVDSLKAAGTTILKEPNSDAYGVFATVLDPEGNQVELWQPAAKD